MMGRQKVDQSQLLAVSFDYSVLARNLCILEYDIILIERSPDPRLRTAQLELIRTSSIRIGYDELGRHRFVMCDCYHSYTRSISPIETGWLSSAATCLITSSLCVGLMCTA